MEDAVFQIVNEICDEKARSDQGGAFCTSPKCRLDIACFVLNRITPRYVTSGRGLAHVETDYQEDRQNRVDIVTLANEGLKRISLHKREYYSDDTENGCVEEEQGPLFNFPAIKGRLLNGKTFEPVKGVQISLLQNEKLVPMASSRWQNPYAMVQSTSGNFLFWPAPVPAEGAGEKRSFEFELSVDTEGFEPFRHYFNLELESDSHFVDVFRFYKDVTLSDLFLLPK
jgi:competence protein ComFB